MSQLVSLATAALRQRISLALEQAMAAGALPQAEPPAFTLEIPGDRAHGDWSCNAAMTGAKAFRAAPAKIAVAIRDHLDLSGTYFDRCEIAGPGFLNFYYTTSFTGDVLKDILDKGEKYGCSDFGAGRKVMVEFVSANPTGPMHMGNARGGALGDCLAAVLEAAGYEASREFYVNDAGNQLEKFGLSLDIRYRQIFETEHPPELPEDSYHGEDIAALARAYADAHGDKLMTASEADRRKALVEFGLPINIGKMQGDMARYAVAYDTWFFESTLHKTGQVQETIQLLTQKGLTYEQEGAIWYKATEFGGEKDEVLVRQNGIPTYFASDIAYHRNKLQRGFDWLIDIWGADHHGHVARMKGAMAAIGEDPAKLDIVLMQFVRLMRDGEVVRMSKRTGKAIQLGDLLDEVSTDAARFLFNLREANTVMDFDLDLAIAQDSQNPVYYVQYAHARICSILRNLKTDGIVPRACTSEELALLVAPEEVELTRYLSSYTEEIVSAAKSLDPSRITKYVINLATLFHKFYNACRVKGEEESLSAARLTLCVATQTVIRNVLTMFKVTVPDSM